MGQCLETETYKCFIFNVDTISDTNEPIPMPAFCLKQRDRCCRLTCAYFLRDFVLLCPTVQELDSPTAFKTRTGNHCSVALYNSIKYRKCVYREDQFKFVAIFNFNRLKSKENLVGPSLYP